MLTTLVIGRLLLPPLRSNRIDAANRPHVTFPIQVVTWLVDQQRWTETVLHLHLYDEGADIAFTLLTSGMTVAARVSHIWSSWADEDGQIVQYLNLDACDVEPIDIARPQMLPLQPVASSVNA